MTQPEPPDNALAKAVLTDVQYLTWFMAEQGTSQRAIAYYRLVSKRTVSDCLVECDTKIRRAKDAEDS